MAKRLLNVHQAAEQLGLKDKTLRQWISLRKIEFIKVGMAVRIDQSEVDRILRCGRVRRIERPNQMATHYQE